ncbi:hypothetical protein R1flu_023041 [Riccia fluitans]|uniref:EF-hand domain-containing protein n=1 Tax=Riccia fluitans TaxID=41844 RepID=A0ABD1XQW4_9MARC
MVNQKGKLTQTKGTWSKGTHSKGAQSRGTKSKGILLSNGEIDWKAVAAKLPSEKTPEAKAKRSKLFSEFDPNGNGFLSLAEVDRGICDVLQLEGLFNCKPAILRAFQASKGVAKSNSKLGDDYVERSEFRLLMVYLRQYFELYEMFKKLDTSHDRRVDLDEFKAALPLLESWGVKISDAEAEFEKIDANSGGSILFDEFADWALKGHLELLEHNEH